MSLTPYRVRDWLHGIRLTQPPKDLAEAFAAEPILEAEKLRCIHTLITAPKSEGGAEITPKIGDWKNVESIFPLHDHGKNKEWLNRFSKTTTLSQEDLDELRVKFGTKVGFYFAFLQDYFKFLMLPALFGFSCWILFGHFSVVYAVANCLWCVGFVEYYKRRESDLGIRWGVKGVSAVLTTRKEFQHETTLKDPITGETVRFFSAKKRLLRQLYQIPFALLASLALGTLIATCFGIEIFISEVYDGPLKSVLVFIPTGLLTLLVPTITTALTNVATRLTEYENYETQDSHDVAMTQKIFVLNFITSYLPILLTAFVYVPFGSIIVPHLDVFSLTVKPFATDDKQMQTPSSGSFEINPSRLRKQVIYFTVTAQIVNFGLETVLPWVKRKGMNKYKEMQDERAAKKGGAVPAAGANDLPEEADFLHRVREEAELDDYDVTTDLREMAIQFGYLALFSPVWPLVPLSFLINNWVELRSDLFKICIECKRPVPHRADSIGPWLDSIAFLTWLGSITSAALVYMFSNDGLGPDGNPHAIKPWALLLSIFFSEHIYLLVRLGFRTVFSKIESDGSRKEKAERYATRKRYLTETFGQDEAEETDLLESGKAEKITREALEEDARAASLGDAGPEQRFWARQRGWEEVVQIGSGLIEAEGLGKKGEKKTQ